MVALLSAQHVRFSIRTQVCPLARSCPQIQSSPYQMRNFFGIKKSQSRYLSRSMVIK